MNTGGQNFERYSLYAKNRYPYNQPVQAAYNVRGNSATLGSGVRGPTSTGQGSTFHKDTSFLTDFSEVRESNPYYDRRIATIKIKAALAFEIVASIVGLVVFVSPGWGKTIEDAVEDPVIRGNLKAYYGIWMYCRTNFISTSEMTCTNVNLINGCEGSTWKIWWTAVQVLNSVAFVFSLLLILLISVYICKKSANRKVSLACINLILSVICVLAAAASIILFAVMFLDDAWWCRSNGEDVVDAELFWAWYIHILQFLFLLIAGIATLAEFVSLKRM